MAEPGLDYGSSMVLPLVVGRNLKRLRNIAGLSQRGLALVSDLKWKHDVVSRVEKGSRSLSVDELVWLACFFRVEMSEFFRPIPGVMAVYLTTGERFNIDRFRVGLFVDAEDTQ